MAATSLEAAALGLAVLVGAGSVGTAILNGAENLAALVGSTGGSGQTSGTPAEPEEPAFDGNYAAYNWNRAGCESVGGVYQASNACTAPPDTTTNTSWIDPSWEDSYYNSFTDRNSCKNATNGNWYDEPGGVSGVDGICTPPGT